MKFRLRAFGLHLLASAAVLSITLGTLFIGWYHWPGWYLTGVLHVVAVMAGVDVVLGPSLTLIIASTKKPRRVLLRDIAIIATFQFAALIYGTTALWSGRPLYYAFSVDCLSVVQAYDIDKDGLALARRQNSALLPHWYSLPRWIWAPLPEDSKTAQEIVASLVQGGDDVTAMPQYYKSWNEGLSELRTHLQKVDDIKYFSRKEKKLLKDRLHAAGLAADQSNGIALTGRGRPLLVVVDPSSLTVSAILKAT